MQGKKDTDNKKKSYRKYKREKLEKLLESKLRQEIWLDFDLKVRQGIRDREKEEKKASSILFASIRRYNKTLEKMTSMMKDMDFIFQRIRTKPVRPNAIGGEKRQEIVNNWFGGHKQKLQEHIDKNQKQLCDAEAFILGQKVGNLK